MNRYGIAALLCLLLGSCATYRRSGLWTREIECSAVFARGITGLFLVDAQTGRALADVRGDRYFTPASNTKILTLATCLYLLSDTLLPGLHVCEWPVGDTPLDSRIIVKGVGDPAFLHPRFAAWQQPFAYLRRHPATAVWLYPPAEELPRFGPGWAWDDYAEDYQPERGALPLYGHVLRAQPFDDGSVAVWPPYFRDSVQLTAAVSSPRRAEWENRWVLPAFSEGGRRDYWLPFRPLSPAQLLADTLGKAVEWLPDSLLSRVPLEEGWQTLRGAPLDTVLRRMMHQSDNFIAEQMLLLCAVRHFGVLRTDNLIRWMLDSVWPRLPQRPRWVDGSGLSRYNLITPQALVHVLQQLWQQQPRERLFNLFPAGGRDGTVAGWYAPNPGEEPWLFAKTGTLSGVHCLSGYLVARSGRVLIFSFMHTNFIGSNIPWKRETERLLRRIRERY